MALYNPFAHRREVTRANILWYRILTFATWLLNIVPIFYYTYHAPHDPGHYHGHPRRSIFGQSQAHPTPFTMSYVFVDIYWIGMFIGQLGYIWHLFVDNEVWVRAACSVGPHFILWNILNFVWVMLWTRSHFVLSEFVQVLNFLQLTSLYFRHSLPAHRDSEFLSLSNIKSIHIPTVSMPLVWTFFALFWNGAVMVRCENAAVCRILANVAIWGIVPFAGVFLFGYGDWTVGLATSFLAAGLAVGQFFMKVFALQWIFGFTIMAIVFLSTLSIITPIGTRVATGERAPLLTEDA